MTSYIMEQHQKNNNGNSMMIRQMLDTFRLPKDFDSLVYLSMVLQAEGIRYGVEHWRRYPERVAGTLYWQLNDCWPVASWSSLDYFGRWKALHYAARRFYAPILLSIEDRPPEMAVYVSNDILTACNGVVNWSLETFDGKTISRGSSPINATPQSATRVCQLDFTKQVNDDNLRKVVFVAELVQAEQLISRQVATFAPIKHLELQKPTIDVHMESHDGKLAFDLESNTLALLVELSLEGRDAVFSDNYVSLLAGRKVQITCPYPQGWNMEQVMQAFHIRSIYDSYSHPSDS
jgi:beta-mannosidase